MPDVEVRFLEGEKLSVTAVDSGTQFFIDKAADGHAASGPNPLEVFLASLGGCMSVYGRRYLDRHSIHFKNFTVKMSADFCQDPPARLINIKAVVTTDAMLSQHKGAFLNFMEACPVHHTVAKAEAVSVVLA